jgi:DNA repair protein RadC
MAKRADTLIESSGGSDPIFELRSCDDQWLYELAAPGFGSILADTYSSPRELLGADPTELISVGLSEEVATRMLASWEILRRARAPRSGEPIKAPDDAAEYFFEMLADCAQERVAALALDSAHAVISARIVFSGGLDRSIVDPKILFSELIRLRAPAFVLAHNHPSGNLDPSTHDIAVTERLQSAADLLDVAFLDHLIVSGERWCSLRALGILPPLGSRPSYCVSAVG